MPGSHSKYTTSRSQAGRKKPRLTSPVRRKKPGFFIRILRHVPRWAWWIGGLAIISVYIAFFYYLFVSPYGFRWRALYGEVNYPEGFDIHGIDVSHYQGDIDWEILRNQGTIDDCPIRFVMIKATEGATKVDENFEDNFYQAREYGFTRGAYHFYSTRSSAADQARFFIRNVKLENGDLPPVLDVEHKPKGQTTEAFKKSVLEWLQIVEKHYGVKPILYTYYKFRWKILTTRCSTSILTGLPITMWTAWSIRDSGSSGNIPMLVVCRASRVLSTSISTTGRTMICVS